MTAATNNQSHPFGERIKEFFVSTPAEVLGAGVAGAILQIFSTKLALPSYGVLLGCILSRLSITILSKFKPEAASAIINKTNQFHEKFFIIPIIAWIAATILSWFVPIAGFVIGIAIGIYYGPIAEKGHNLSYQEKETANVGL